MSNTNQMYENYWSLTLEYTDFNGEGFNKTLELIIKYIDKYNGNISSEIYQDLQEELNKITPKEDMVSIRKAINQFLKLGFINNYMKSYHRKTKDFLNEKDISRKKRIYSEILYDNASFSRAFSKPSNTNELNFLIKTLEHCGSITKDNLLALMYQNINYYPKGYVTLDELKIITDESIENNTSERKYNQRDYLYGLCKNILSGIYINQSGNITLDKDEQIEEFVRKGRDAYKQRLYKYDLYRECVSINNKVVCYIEDISYPVLIASHIKPYRYCKEEEKFDVDNGLLLSKNIDHLFDQGWISFNDDGSILYAEKLDEILKKKLKTYFLDKKYLSTKRLNYLKYHRENIFDKNKNYNFNFIK